MRFLVIPALAVTLISPDAAVSQGAAQAPLDAAPMIWRGVPLGPEQVFEGDYTINFETSAFQPDGAPSVEAVWLAGWEDRPGDNGGITRRYHLRFVGRHTVEPGRYGSLGAYRHEVLITRLISARLLIKR